MDKLRTSLQDQLIILRLDLITVLHDMKYLEKKMQGAFEDEKPEISQRYLGCAWKEAEICTKIDKLEYTLSLIKSESDESKEQA